MTVINVAITGGSAIPIPCPIPPSVTFEVVLVECVEALKTAILPSAKSRCGLTSHHERCPARPIRVSCSISGKTWEESDAYVAPGLACTTDQYTQVWNACRDRWTLVKALVTGRIFDPNEWDTPDTIRAMLAQRDAVFAALADMRRAEKASHAAFLALPMDLRKASIIAKQCSAVAADPEDGGIDLPSAKIFALYVQRLIEQVGNI